MSLRVTPVLVSALLVSTSLVAPAFAQSISAQQAWNNLQSSAAAQGFQLNSSGQTPEGETLIVQNLRVTPPGSGKDLVISIPQVRISPQGEGVVLQTSPEFSAMARFAGSVTRQFTIRNDGDIAYRAGEDVFYLLLSAPNLSIEQTHATRRGQPLNESLEIDFQDMEAEMDVTRDGTIEFDFNATQTAYEVRSPDPEIGEMDGTITDLAVEFGGREFDEVDDNAGSLERAFAAGFGAYLRVQTGRSEGRSNQTMEGTVYQANSTSESGSVELELRDGRFEASVSGAQGEIAGQIQNIPFGGTIGGVGIEVSGPMVRTSDMQPANLGMALDQLTLSEQTLRMFNAQEFTGEAMTFRLRSSLDGRVTQDLSDYDGDEPPFDVSEVRLDELLVSVGDSNLTGAGAFTFLGGLLASVGSEMPNGTGDFNFELVGGNALLNRLVTAGLVPQQQIFVVQMMMNGLGRAVGEDHLVSEVTIRPGGDVRVNGAPLPF